MPGSEGNGAILCIPAPAQSAKNRLISKIKFFKAPPYRRRRESMLSGLIWTVVIGFIAGWLAGKVMKGSGYSVLMDIVLGIVGGVIGRFVFGLLGLSAWSVTGSIIVSFVGAVILIWLVRQLKKA